MKTEKYDEVFNSYDNLEDILNVITDDGIDELQFHKEATVITRLGVMTTFVNREGKPFKVIVCPESMNDSKLKETIVEMSSNLQNLTDSSFVL
jgi:hypothetical protein